MHGPLSLLAGIDLLTGEVHALVRDRHRSREFIKFLRLLDAAYPASTAIKLILDKTMPGPGRLVLNWPALISCCKKIWPTTADSCGSQSRYRGRQLVYRQTMSPTSLHENRV